MSAYMVETSYHRERMEFFAHKYEAEFKHWSDFFAAYSKKELSRDNLDYDEWAFLCEQMLYEQTESSPPCDCLEFDERPESISGLRLWSHRIVQPRSVFRDPRASRFGLQRSGSTHRRASGGHFPKPLRRVVMVHMALRSGIC